MVSQSHSECGQESCRRVDRPEMDLEGQPEDSPGAHSTLTALNCLLFLGRSPSLTEFPEVQEVGKRRPVTP